MTLCRLGMGARWDGPGQWGGHIPPALRRQREFHGSSTIRRGAATDAFHVRGGGPSAGEGGSLLLPSWGAAGKFWEPSSRVACHVVRKSEFPLELYKQEEDPPPSPLPGPHGGGGVARRSGWGGGKPTVTPRSGIRPP